MLFTITFNFSQNHIDLLHKLESFTQNDAYNTVEPEILTASSNVLFQPFSVMDAEKINALAAIDRWIKYSDTHTFPIMGTLYNAINKDTYLISIYKVAMANYILNQKFNHNRVITCDINPPKRKTYLEQNDVRELHYESAIIFIDYLTENKKTNQNKALTEIITAYNKNMLREVLFKS